MTATNRAPLRPCPVPHCRKLIRPPARRCHQHARQADEARGGAWARGYTRPAWQVFRAQWLAAHPCCGDRLASASPVHSRCVQLGQRTRATDVDHIVRVRGPDDPRFFDPTAVQSLCHSCHSRKTGGEDQ